MTLGRHHVLSIESTTLVPLFGDSSKRRCSKLADSSYRPRLALSLREEKNFKDQLNNLNLSKETGSQDLSGLLVTCTLFLLASCCCRHHAGSEPRHHEYSVTMEVAKWWMHGVQDGSSTSSQGWSLSHPSFDGDVA